uniref:AAA-associated domain-containing protein n=1 Tax=Paraburkholderia sp. C35 TaxID=2126993 RepID=UPI0019529023
LEMLAAAPYNGRADMPEIARSLHLEVDDLFPIAEVLQHLAFADMREGDVILTPAGREFADLGTQERKALFAKHLLRQVPLAARIKEVLDERRGHRAPRVRFEQELEDFIVDEVAQDVLDAVIDWGRYAEIFSYTDKTEVFSLADVEA